MKTKLIVIVLLVALASSCAFLTSVKDLLCNPTDEQIAQAQAAAEFMDWATSFFPMAETSWFFAKEVFKGIQKNVCTLKSDLEEAVKIFDEAAAKARRTTKLKCTIAPHIPDISALRKVK